MNLRLPDPEIIRAEPRLANLSENAVYHLLMRRRRKFGLGAFASSYLAALVVVGLFWWGLELLAPASVNFMGSLFPLFMLVSYRFQKATRRGLAREFLGYTKEESEHYALLPISPEEIVLAHWGKALQFRPIVLTLFFCAIGLFLMIYGIASASWLWIGVANVAFYIGSFWVGVAPYNVARTLIQTALASWHVRHAFTSEKERRESRSTYKYSNWIAGATGLPLALVFLTTLFTGFIVPIFSKPPGITFVPTASLLIMTWGYLTGKYSGLAARSEVEMAIQFALRDVAFIQQAAFGHLTLDSK